MATETEETTDPYEQLQAGDAVKHPKFGEGQILHRTGSGDDTKFVVSFAEEGEKRLLARYAQLKKVRPIPAAAEEDDSEEEGDEAEESEEDSDEDSEADTKEED